MNEKQLLELKEEIDAAQQKASELDGQRKYLLQQLEEFDVDDVKGAKQELKRLEDSLQEEKDALEEATSKIVEQYSGKA